MSSITVSASPASSISATARSGSRSTAGSSAYSGWFGQTWWFSATRPSPWLPRSSSTELSMASCTALRTSCLSKGGLLTFIRRQTVLAVSASDISSPSDEKIST
jgi:hypothetical protein